MSYVKANPEEIRSGGKTLVNDADSYLADVKSMYGVIDQLRDTWKGADNQQFCSTLDGYKENINALGQVIGNYGVFLQETGNSLEKLQADVADQAGRL